MQIDSNLVVIKLNTFFLSIGTKSGCMRTQPSANVLEMFVKVASSFMTIQFRNQLGHSVLLSRATVAKMDVVESNKIVPILRPPCSLVFSLCHRIMKCCEIMKFSCGS